MIGMGEGHGVADTCTLQVFTRAIGRQAHGVRTSCQEHFDLLGLQAGALHEGVEVGQGVFFGVCDTQAIGSAEVVLFFVRGLIVPVQRQGEAPFQQPEWGCNGTGNQVQIETDATAFGHRLGKCRFTDEP